MISASKNPFSLFREYHKKSSAVIEKWGRDIRREAQSSEILDNLLKIFSVNGIKNGKRAENYNYIVKSMGKRLSFEHVDFIRQELDDHDNDPNMVIGLLYNMIDAVAANVIPKSKPKPKTKPKPKPKTKPKPNSKSKAGPTKDDSWKDLAILIQHTLKKKLSQKDLIFIRDEITKNKTDPNYLYEIFRNYEQDTNSNSVAKAAPAPKKSVPIPPPLLPSVYLSKPNPPVKSRKSQVNGKDKSLKINFRKRRVKSMNPKKEDIIGKFKKEKLKELNLNFSDDLIFNTLKMTNYNFDHTLDILLQSI